MELPFPELLSGRGISEDAERLCALPTSCDLLSQGTCDIWSWFDICRDTVWKTEAACVTMEEMLFASAGMIIVLPVLAMFPKASTYCSARRSATASRPDLLLIAFETATIPAAVASALRVIASASPLAWLIACSCRAVLLSTKLHILGML